jgi:hypothetical protein
LPRWLVWTGFGCAVILLFSVVFVPMIALPIWVVAVSVALLRRARTPHARHSSAPRPTSRRIEDGW